MSSTSDTDSPPIAVSARELRHLLRYALGSIAVLLLLIAYCELCSVVNGLPAPGLRISAPWALQVSLPWIVIGAGFGMVGHRVADHSFAATHPRALVGAVILGVTAFALAFEAFLMELRGGETTLAIFIYQRTPVDVAASALLVAMYLGSRFFRGRHPSTAQYASAADSPNAYEPTAAAPRPEASPSPADGLIEVMTGTGRAHIPVKEIECLQADGNYISVMHVSGRTYLLRQTMAAAQRSLDGQRFVRIHRSTIVNRHLIKERRSGSVLVLQSGRTVNVSRAYRTHLLH